MNKADENFNEEFKPLPIPATYHTDSSLQEKVIYALAYIEAGTAEDIAHKIQEFESNVPLDEILTFTSEILTGLFDKGLLKGSTENNITTYNLSKIETPNNGKINPELLQ